MSRDLSPPGLAALVDVAERPRTHNWSLRAALTRYAQPEPSRVSRLLESVRRVETALAGHTALLRSHGDELWQAHEAGRESLDGVDDAAAVLGLLGVAADIDRVADLLAAWAVDRQGERPDAAVDATAERTAARLDELGVPREERLPPSARPGRRRG